jgi:hypothetical protein
LPKARLEFKPVLSLPKGFSLFLGGWAVLMSFTLKSVRDKTYWYFTNKMLRKMDIESSQRITIGVVIEIAGKT